MRKEILQFLFLPSLWIFSINGFRLSKFHMSSQLCFRLYNSMSTSGPESENPQNHVCSLPPSHVYETLGERLKGTSVYFVGMMGCGKSATSEIFAKKLGYRKLDTDEIAEFMVNALLYITFFVRSLHISDMIFHYSVKCLLATSSQQGTRRFFEIWNTRY